MLYIECGISMDATVVRRALLSVFLKRIEQSDDEAEEISLEELVTYRGIVFVSSIDAIIYFII